MIQIDFTTKSTLPEYVVHKYGFKCLLDENGEYHSYNDLPAVVMQNGSKGWFKHGIHHRDNDLPSYIGSTGIKEYWVDGKRIK